jgi:CRP-like cAMP-binding protein
MAMEPRPSFDPKSFLAKVGEGRSIGKYRKDQIVFSQGDPADAVFYIQEGKVKVTVVSEHGKEAVVAVLGTNDFFGALTPSPHDPLVSGSSLSGPILSNPTGRGTFPNNARASLS